MKNKILQLKPLLAIFALLFISCYEPSPLYGTWADNLGNQISFMSDGTFVATIYDSTDEKTLYQGTYSVVENVLVFTYTPDGSTNSYSTNTEWDIRGSMLYCHWTTTSDGVEQQLTLYHTSK